MVKKNNENDIRAALEQIDLGAIARHYPGMIHGLAMTSAAAEALDEVDASPDEDVDDFGRYPHLDADGNVLPDPDACDEDEADASVDADDPESNVETFCNAKGFSEPGNAAYEGKFRGIVANAPEGELPQFVHGGLVDGPDGPLIVSCADDGTLMQTLVRRRSIGQCTGLVDVDGRDIYAGDILMAGGKDGVWPNVYVIRWITGKSCGGFRLTSVVQPTRNAILSSYCQHQFCVIGTVYTGVSNEYVKEFQRNLPEAAPETNDEDEEEYPF